MSDRKTKRQQKTHPVRRALKWTAAVALLLCTAFLLGGAVWVMGLYGMTELDVEKITSASQTLFVYDGEDTAIAGVHGTRTGPTFP